jgi:hypothetical protein
MLKVPWGISDTEKAKFSLLRPFLLLGPDVSAGRTAWELWWTSQELSPAGIIITMALHAHISPGGCTMGPLVTAVLRHSLTPSQSINQGCHTPQGAVYSAILVWSNGRMIIIGQNRRSLRNSSPVPLYLTRILLYVTHDLIWVGVVGSQSSLVDYGHGSHCLLMFQL